MNGFIQCMVVLSVLWAFCEMLLPSGKTRQMALFVVSLMLMLSLLGSVTELLRQEPARTAYQPVLVRAQDSPNGRRIYLQAIANQLRTYTIGQANRAGYSAEATVYLTVDGMLERMELTLWKRDEKPPLMTGMSLAQTLARTLEIPPETIRLSVEEDAFAD